jgi:hypothetical protein
MKIIYDVKDNDKKKHMLPILAARLEANQTGTQTVPVLIFKRVQV